MLNLGSDIRLNLLITMAEDKPVKSQQILRKQMKPTFKQLSITKITKTRPNALVLCLPPTHWRNKRKHLLQFLCQTREKKLTPSDRQVCIHNDWWTEIIWNKDKECYYTNGILKWLHDYNKTDSKESKEEQHQKGKEPMVDQQIRQMPIDPALWNSPVISTTNLPATMTTTTTETATTSQFTRSTPTAQQRIAAAMQKVLLHKGKGTGPPGGGGTGPPWGGGLGPPRKGGPRQPGGGGQSAATQQPVQVVADVKVMGSLSQIFNGDRAKADNFIKEVKGYFHLNADVAGFNSPYKKVAFTLMLIKGDKPAQWVQNMGNWLNTLDPVANNVEDLWDQFLEAYAYQFQDSQAA